MPEKISKRLLQVAEAIPLKRGIRILEIGCGPGALARELANRVEDGFVLGIDRSSKAIEQAKKGSRKEMASGKLNFLQAKVEDFELSPAEERFDVAIAIRVGALDGRHPEMERKALEKIAKAVKKKGKLFIDGGDPLMEITLVGHGKKTSP